MLIHIINITTQQEVIVIEDPDECTHSKPIIVLLSIAAILAAILIIFGNIAEAIWTTLFMLSFVITLLLINKRKYFKSEQWKAITFAYANDIKMINALSASIKSSLKIYAHEININCSAETFAHVESDPVNTIINCFETKSTSSILKYLKELEREYRIMKKELVYIKNRIKVIEQIKNKIPFWVRILTLDIYKHMELYVVESIRYPKYKFSYYCNASGHYQTCVIIVDEKLISAIKANLSQT